MQYPSRLLRRLFVSTIHVQDDVLTIKSASMVLAFFKEQRFLNRGRLHLGGYELAVLPLVQNFCDRSPGAWRLGGWVSELYPRFWPSHRLPYLSEYYGDDFATGRPFALGALAHYASDNEGHPMGTNRAVPLLYPKLQKRYGDSVTYEEDKLAHVKTEFGLQGTAANLLILRHLFCPCRRSVRFMRKEF